MHSVLQGVLYKEWRLGEVLQEGVNVLGKCFQTVLGCLYWEVINITKGLSFYAKIVQVPSERRLMVGVCGGKFHEQATKRVMF